MNRWAIATCFMLLFAVPAGGASLEALPEFMRPDPFGNVIAIDRGSQTSNKPLALTGARVGYVSFHLLVKLPEGGKYRLSLNLDDKSGRIQADLFREWFHLTDSDGKYYPDALVPVKQPYGSMLPEPDNAIQKQTTQPFWVDLWIPADAVPGLYRGAAYDSLGSVVALVEVVSRERHDPEDSVR